jgi:uncharacterized membrane protein
MSRIIRIHEYFVTWFLFALSSVGGGALLGGIIGGFIGGITAALDGDVKSMMPFIGLGSFIAGLTISFVMFSWLVHTMIVKKVEERVKQAMQTSEKTETPLL